MGNQRPLPPLQNRYTGVIEATADCDECDFYTEGRNAVGLGAQHAMRTGHQTRTAQVVVATYNRKEGVQHSFRSPI